LCSWLRSAFFIVSLFNVKIGVWGKGKILVYMSLCAISTYAFEKVWSVNKGTVVNKSEEIRIADREIEDGF
jgi:hypothetical protein